mgnify:CR=1 FL=1
MKKNTIQKIIQEELINLAKIVERKEVPTHSSQNGKLALMKESVNEGKEGEKCYTKDGIEWTGPTHKMPNGKTMTQDPHNKDSEELFHKEDVTEALAEGGFDPYVIMNKSGIITNRATKLQAIGFARKKTDVYAVPDKPKVLKTAQKLIKTMSGAKLKDAMFDLRFEGKLTEATIELDAMEPKAKGFLKLLKNKNVKLKIVSNRGPAGWPVVKLTGKRKDLEAVVADSNYGWDDAKLGEFIKEGKLNEEDYKYKKYVSKAFDKISDAMFDFRHAMGIKQLTNKDMKLKKKFEALQADIFALRREMKKDGLTESKVNEANRSKVFRAAKKGSYPAVIVVIQNGKVIHQEPVSTPEVAPATFNVMQEKYPKAQLHLEDRTGKRLFSESVVNEELVNGGNHYKVGDTITFRLKGEAITGRIEKIKNNKKDPASSELKVRHQKGYNGPSKRYYTDTIKADQIVVSDKYGKWSIDENKLTEAKLRKGDIIKMQDGEYGVVNKLKGKVAYIKLNSNPGSFHPIEADRITYKGKHKGKDLYSENVITEKLARGLKPLLMVGTKISFKVGENTLVKLSDKFDRIDDEQADDIASHLNMGIELMQDGSPSEARAWLKKFNTACKDALKGKPTKSAFEGVNESVVNEAKDNLYLQLHKKYAKQIKGLKEKKIKKLTDLVSVQRRSMEDRKDYFDMDSNKKKKLSAEYNGERKLFKKYIGGDESVMLPRGTEKLSESVLNEMDMNDPILIAVRARKTMLDKAKSAPKYKKISVKQYYKLMDKEIDLIEQMKDAAKAYEQLDSDMNAEAGQKGADWSDADANRYGGDLDKLQTKVEKLAAKKRKVKSDIMNYRVN